MFSYKLLVFCFVPLLGGSQLSLALIQLLFRLLSLASLGSELFVFRLELIVFLFDLLGICLELLGVCLEMLVSRLELLGIRLELLVFPYRLQPLNLIRGY